MARLRSRSTTGTPLFVGIDGRSGAGKSTIAAAVERVLAQENRDPQWVSVIEGDDFYSGGSAEAWDHLTAAQKADWVIDWRRQLEVLTSLRRNGIAQWHRFDWGSEDWDSETVPLAATPTITRMAPVVILEGAYSCRPELQGVLDLLVLLTAAHEVRRDRLIAREGEGYQADWQARWAAAEDHYFGTVMPPERFDLVLE